MKIKNKLSKKNIKCLLFEIEIGKKSIEFYNNIIKIYEKIIKEKKLDEITTKEIYFQNSRYGKMAIKQINYVNKKYLAQFDFKEYSENEEEEIQKEVDLFGNNSLKELGLK